MKTTAWIKNVNRDTGTFFACKQKLTGADLDLELTRIDREKTKVHGSISIYDFHNHQHVNNTPCLYLHV